MVDGTKPWYVRDGTCISSHGDLNLSSVKPCSLKKAITRVLLHVRYMAKQGHRKIIVLTVGTDVLVLTVSVYEESKNSIEELWVDFGAGKDRKYVPFRKSFNS